MINTNCYELSANLWIIRQCVVPVLINFPTKNCIILFLPDIWHCREFRIMLLPFLFLFIFFLFCFSLPQHVCVCSQSYHMPISNLTQLLWEDVGTDSIKLCWLVICACFYWLAKLVNWPPLSNFWYVLFVYKLYKHYKWDITSVPNFVELN